MTGDPGDLDGTYREALVELILAVRRYADAMRSHPEAGRVDHTRGIDAAGSITDLDPPLTPTGDRSVALDGGDYRFTARETAEGLLVVGDFRGVPASGRETQVDLLEDALVLTVDGRVVSRVPVEDGWSTITGVSVNNDVLEVRVRIRE